MQRAIRLKAEHEATHGFRYDAVLVSRWDLVWWSRWAAAVLGDAARSQALRPAVWLPDMCASESIPPATNESSFMGAVCGTAERDRHRLRVTSTPSAARCTRYRACQWDLSATARGYYVYECAPPTPRPPRKAMTADVHVCPRHAAACGF